MSVPRRRRRDDTPSYVTRSGAEVVLLGDAEYDNTEMLAWVQAHTTWQFVMRTAGNLLIGNQGH